MRSYRTLFEKEFRSHKKMNRIELLGFYFLEISFFKTQTKIFLCGQLA